MNSPSILRCASCNGQIEYVEDGYVEWAARVNDTAVVERPPRLVHSFTAKPGCQYDQRKLFASGLFLKDLPAASLFDYGTALSPVLRPAFQLIINCLVPWRNPESLCSCGQRRHAHYLDPTAYIPCDGSDAGQVH